MLECSIQKVPRNNVGDLADVRRGQPHTHPTVPVQDFPENAVTNAVEVCFGGFPECFVCFRVDSQLRGWGRSFFLPAWHLQIAGLLCSKHWLYEVLHGIGCLPPWVADMFISKSSFGLIGLIAGLALVIEEQRRHAELLMYILPRAMESAWKIAGGSKYFRKVTNMDGEVIVSAFHPSSSIGFDLFYFFCVCST